MDDEEYEEYLKKEKIFLDTIDLLNLIKSKDFFYLSLFMDYIQQNYGDKYKDEKDIFNWMDEYDFMQYRIQMKISI